MAIQPQVTVYAVPVRAPHPLAARIAAQLGRAWGRGINGHTGTIRYGDGGSIQAQRRHFTGYAEPPQLFRSWSATRVAGGRARLPTPALSSSTMPAGAAQNSPLMAAMAAVTTGAQRYGSTQG